MGRKSDDFGKAADAAAGLGEVAGAAAESGLVKPETAEKVAVGTNALSGILRLVSNLTRKKR